MAVVILRRDGQSHSKQDRSDLGDVVAARLFVHAVLQTPLDVALCSTRPWLAKGVERSGIPAVDRGLGVLVGLGVPRQLRETGGSVPDVAELLLNDARQHLVEWLVRRADHLFYLEATHAI